jgi:hypothetical protein
MSTPVGTNPPRAGDAPGFELGASPLAWGRVNTFNLRMA